MTHFHLPLCTVTSIMAAPDPSTLRAQDTPAELLLQMLESQSALALMKCVRAGDRLKSISLDILARRFESVVEPYTQGPAGVEEFRQAMFRSRACIAGSASLWFLQPGNWTPSDLNIIVPTFGFQRWRRFLKKSGCVVTSPLNPRN